MNLEQSNFSAPNLLHFFASVSKDSKEKKLIKTISIKNVDFSDFFFPPLFFLESFRNVCKTMLNKFGAKTYFCRKISSLRNLKLIFSDTKFFFKS